MRDWLRGTEALAVMLAVPIVTWTAGCLLLVYGWPL